MVMFPSKEAFIQWRFQSKREKKDFALNDSVIITLLFIYYYSLHSRMNEWRDKSKLDATAQTDNFKFTNIFSLSFFQLLPINLDSSVFNQTYYIPLRLTLFIFINILFINFLVDVYYLYKLNTCQMHLYIYRSLCIGYDWSC